jgi:hypothetical protein
MQNVRRSRDGAGYLRETQSPSAAIAAAKAAAAANGYAEGVDGAVINVNERLAAGDDRGICAVRRERLPASSASSRRNHHRDVDRRKRNNAIGVAPIILPDATSPTIREPDEHLV